MRKSFACQSWLARNRAVRACRRETGRRGRRRGWVLLETVIATGLLILGLAVIGAQVQDADTSIHKMELQLRAMMLAERQLAELDLGLVELDSIDEIEEEEFGPRYPDFGWRLITDDSGLEEFFLLTLEILYLPQDPEDYGDYQEGDFDFDNAEVLFTIRALRPTPQPVNLGEEFGLEEDEFVELSEKLTDLGIEGVDANEFDPTVLAKADPEELLKILSTVADLFGIDLRDLAGSLPADLLDTLEETGVLEGPGTGSEAGEGINKFRADESGS